MTEHAEPVVASAGEASIKVKQERIDAEVESKLKSLKEAKLVKNAHNAIVDYSDEPESESDTARSPQSVDDKKSIAPVKSSNELLAELFGVFNAAPPDELLDDRNLLKKASKHKKVKKEKKKKHKREKPDDGEYSDTGSKDALDGDGKHKHKKKKKHKNKHRDDKDKCAKSRDRAKSKDKDRKKPKVHVVKENVVAKNRDKTNERSTTPIALSNVKQEENRDRKRSSDGQFDDQIATKTSRIERSLEQDFENSRTHNSFYNGFQEHDGTVALPKEIKSELERKYSNSRHKSGKYSEFRGDDVLSDISLSDEETYLRERENGKRRQDDAGETKSTSSRAHNSFYSGSSSQRSGGGGGTDRAERRYNHRKRTRSRSHSRSHDLNIDKKRLLEIARKNAISMFKRGQMPGAERMSQEIKDKVLLKMRYGGRTVEDLTEFCKKISNGEDLPDLSSDEDSDVDKSGNAKAFHHPFQLKEREPIVMHIRNATPIVPARKTELHTKAITMQFPVSSGQQHRNSEVWVPVDKPTSLAPLPSLPPAKQSTTIFKEIPPKNVFEKPIPASEQQEPAFTPINTASMNSTPVQQVELANIFAPTNVEMIPSSPAIPPAPLPPVIVNSVPMPSFIPEVPIPSTQQHNMVFPEIKPPAVDVSSIITKRLSAIRRLQENPTDPEALKMMYNAQRDMTSWASSKHIPGQFTGSTGANIMKAHELNSGPQLWARRDQLTSTKPVSGGMGMALLQKMGWKPGEGLGPSKTGSLQPLLLDIKLDKRGLVSREDTCYQRPPSAQVQRNKKNASNATGQTLLNIENKHPVCVLNELTSKNKWTPPKYTLINDKGPSHSRMFLFSVEINGKTYSPSHASNTKKEAKMMAAKMCLQQLGILSSQLTIS